MVEARARLEELEENTKKQVEDTVGQLFRSHKEAVGNKKLTISTVEDMMLEARAETERILKNVMQAMIKANEEDLIEKNSLSPLRKRTDQT